MNSMSLESGFSNNNFTQIRQIFRQYYVGLWNQAVTPSNLSDYLFDVSKIDHDSDIFPLSPLITKQEVTTAINSVKHAVPGSVTASFYVSLPALVPILTLVFNNAYLQNKLSNSQGQAFVKLLLKSSHPSSVKDWRPISLLNVDYKILYSYSYSQQIETSTSKLHLRQTATWPTKPTPFQQSPQH